MKRTTLILPEPLRAQAKRRAQDLEISFGEFVRRAIIEALDGASEAAPSVAHRWPVFEGPVPHDLAKNHDRYLHGDEAGSGE